MLGGKLLKRGRSGVALLVAAALPFGLTGCFTYKNVKKDRTAEPVVMTGVGATILYPGQNPATLPTLPPGVTHPSQASQSRSSSGTAPGTTTQSRSGSGSLPSSGSAPVFIGGSGVELEQHRRERQEPKWYNPFWFPIAVVLAPVRGAKKLGRWVAGDPDEPEATPTTSAPASGAPLSTRHESEQAAHERAQLEALERQLAKRGSKPGPPPSGHAAPVGAAPASELSIAQELASLREAPPVEAAPGIADRVEDRNGDGRPDHWVYRAGDRIVRERFDDRGDGRPDRTVFYDPTTGLRERVEEDLDGDGGIDSWSYYEKGRLARRRVDRNGDGSIDAWTFYRGERVVRHEEDRNGDGFRDRSDFYDEGRLARREEDADGDGRPERITVYDAHGEPLRIEEDRDGDGRPDVRSHYTEGRLSRRELLTELAAQQAADPQRAAGESAPPSP